MSALEPYFETEDGRVRIYHGDCLDVLPSLEVVDHVITDPPYTRDVYMRMRSQDSPGGNRRHKIKGNDSLIAMAAGDIGVMNVEVADAAARQIARLIRRWGIVFSDAESTGLWRLALEGAGARYVRTGAWVKPDAMPQMTGDRPGVGFEPCTIVHAPGRLRWNGGGKFALWTHNIVKGADRLDHPCPKPLALMRELVQQFTDSGDVILDPFMGSGTTLRAAYDLGRRAIGIELEEKFCELAAQRLSQGVLI